jgi:xylulokinase
MAHFILAHDLGTTGNKATLFDDEGHMVASTFGAYPVSYPQPTWAEQNAGDWWRATVETTRELLRQSPVGASQIADVSFSGQMQGCLPVDAAGRPLRPCIIWADQRAEAQAAQLAERVGEERVYRITGNRISSTYSAAKIMWVRDNEPQVFARTHKFLHVKDYVAWRMCGAFATDRSDAGGMNLYDLDRGNWSEEILQAADLEPERLPDLRNSTEVIGEVTRQASSELGLQAGTPVVIGGGDGPCATVGAGAIAEGRAYNYLGSSSWISFAARRPLYDRQRRFFNLVHLVPNLFAPCGTMQTAGGSYQWLRRELCPAEAREAQASGSDVYEVMNERAAASPPGAHGLLFLPHLQGERSPYWNPKARGAFVGLQITHTRADMIRAVLEGIALNLRSILQAYLENGAQIDEVLVIGGAAKGRLLRQILADVFGRPILCPRLLDQATSLGAAVAGGVGVGLFGDFSAVHQYLEIVDRQDPDPHRAAIYEDLHAAFLSAYAALVPVFDELQRMGEPAPAGREAVPMGGGARKETSR